jgi:hypothetical protein
MADTDKLIVRGQPLDPPGGLVVKSFLDPSVYRFKNQVRSRPVTQLILHETVTRSWKATVDVLKPKAADNPGGRGLGVQLIVDPDGTVYQHGDLATDEHWHAGGQTPDHNPASVGIELVNPYYAKYAPKGGPWAEFIDAPWAHEGRYCVPTPASAEAVHQLTGWLTSPESALSIPRAWLGVKDEKMAFGRIAAMGDPGIYAHYYFGHADGCWPLLYCWLRLEAGFTPEEAWHRAVYMATGVRNSVSLAGVKPS